MRRLGHRIRHDTVAPGLLRQIERLVGAAQQLRGFFCVIREGGNAEGNADGAERPAVIAKLELRYFLPELLGLAQRRVERAFGQEHQELLATSDPRVDRLSAPASSRSTRSPASWPKLSLKRLK